MIGRLRRSGAVALTILLALAASAAGARATVPARAQDRTATQFYMDYRAALAKAQSIDELRSWLAKDNLAKIDATATDERPMLFKMMKMMSLDMKGVKVVKETPTATGVDLSVESSGGMTGPSKGKVTILKEDGGWKLGQEAWSGGAH